MGYAEVCVNSPAAKRRTFSYAVPPYLRVEVGQAVWVPFGERLLQGIVLELSDHPAVEETRDIAGIIEPQPVVSPTRVSLAVWISQHYLSPLFDAVASMLPPGFERKALTFVSITSPPDDFDPSSLSQEQRLTLEVVQQQGKVSLKQLERDLGKKKAQTAVSQLVRRGLAQRSYELEPIRTRPRLELYLSLKVDSSQARQEVTRLKGKRSTKQAALLNLLAEQGRSVSWAEARRRANLSKTVANALADKGLISIEQVEVKRDPLSAQEPNPFPPPILSPAQEGALKDIKANLEETTGKKAQPTTFLLYGVTGSGKTEVYLQALAEAVRLGKKGIVLVPEIALTPQTIERFAGRFPGRVAVLHSQLSLGEQSDEWQRIRNGEFDVVIGPRSALFAPQPNLGLIIIDEEHEWTYKQSDQSPRYHARTVAVKLAELTGAAVVLGSATPDVETFYHSERGEYHRLELPERVTPSLNSPLPGVKVIDMKDELKAGNRSMFSRPLSQAIDKALAANEQVILFLNRRGAATFIQCRDCGFVLRCRRCQVPLTYHLAEDVLACHQCNYQTPVPRLCPQCSGRRIKFLGAGTQKLEQEVSNYFPRARQLRWDSDATRKRHAHQEILDRFRSGQADILIGTQMVTKGLDLPRVTLVGVVNADTALNLPDFRAGERTFQLLSQVAGRAGRGPRGGQVIIQTYTPEHYAIKAAARHDFTLFYEREIGYRRQLHHPPFSRLARLTYIHTNDSRCQREAERMKQAIIEERDAQGTADLSLIGPAPAFIHRLRGRFRWQLIVRSPDPSAFLPPIPIPQGWTVDIDPVGL